MAIRLALGARRRHLFSQFLTQGLILASLGAAGGLLLAFWGVQILPQMFSTQLSRTPLPAHPSEWIDWPVLLFALATAVIAGVVFGLMPAFRAPRLPQETLKAGVRGSTGHASIRALAQRAHRFSGCAVADAACRLRLADSQLSAAARAVARISYGQRCGFFPAARSESIPGRKCHDEFFWNRCSLD